MEPCRRQSEGPREASGGTRLGIAIRPNFLYYLRVSTLTCFEVLILWRAPATMRDAEGLRLFQPISQAQRTGQNKSSIPTLESLQNCHGAKDANSILF